MWFLFSILTALAWGCADLFYKLGAAPADKYSHLKTTATVGLVMGAHAIFYILTGGAELDLPELIRYLPVSLFYILSMALGYFGLRYIELSVSSPVQNSSGAVTAILCCVFFVQSLSGFEIAGVALICAGVVLLAALEKGEPETVGKRRLPARVAILFPIGYCLLDSAGTFLDAVYLGEAESAARFDWLGRILADFRVMDGDTALVAYELTFLACGILILAWLYIVRKERLRPIRQPSRLCAAVLETAGQFFYVRAMSGRAVIAAPMVAAYSIVSVLLSRVVLKERLRPFQYAAVAAVLIGIAVLGFFDA